MDIKNTQQQFGSLTKFFHWSLAILVFIQLYLIFHVKIILPENAPSVGFFIGVLHKPIGVLSLIVAVLSLGWSLINIHPTFPESMPTWEKISARVNHYFLYLCVIVMSVTGLIFSTAGGRPPNFFGLYQFPQFIEKNKAIAEAFFLAHKITAFVLGALIALHILAALKHHFWDKDLILKRMGFTNKP